MNRNKISGNIFLLGLAFILIFLLSSCAIGEEKARKPSDDFSRGLPLADNVISSITVSVEPAGDMVQVILPYESGQGQINFRYIQIDGKAIVKVDQDLSHAFGNLARSPKMVSNGDQLHLIWASRDDTTAGWQIWYALVNQLGEITTIPRIISHGTEWVSQFEISGDGSGGAIVLWEDRDSNEIKSTILSSTGEVTSPPLVYVTNGAKPSLAMDNNGDIHLIWMEEEDLYYSKLDENTALPLQGEKLIDIQLPLGNRVEGPALGLSKEHVYVFWSTLRQTGLEAGTAITEYLVFPEGQPDRVQKGLLNIYPDNKDRFLSYQGEIALSQIISKPPEEYLNTDFVYAPHTGSGFKDTLLVAVAANQTDRLDTHIQIIIGIFEGGEYRGYALPTRTTSISQKPQVSVDKSGHIHLVWQDGSGGNLVFYASTAPEVKARLDKVSFSDMPTLFLSGGLEAITGILLFPFAFPWMAVGLLILIIWRLVHNDEDISLLPSKILLGAALLSFQVSKLLFLPDILIYVPFSAWLDISAGMGLFLKIAVPVFIFGIAFTVAEWRRSQRTSPPSSLFYYIIVIFIDTALTLAIYGVVFLGEY